MQWTIKIIVVLIIIIASILLLVIAQANHRELQSLKEQKKSINIPKKEKHHDSLSADEVKKYKSLVEDKFQSYINYDLPEGTMNTENTGVQTIKSKVSPNGGKIFDKKSSKKEFIKYYSDVDVKVKQISAQNDGKGNVEVFTLVDTKFKGKPIATNYDLISLKFDENNKMIGGHMYGEQ
ncbi:hypothetical protein [Staphylococcus caprae]|nr:hypothetical protein [Staphylococcus caprae]QJE26683.1 hypothetical protein HHJ99_13005 [Staphylococcus caprae]